MPAFVRAAGIPFALLHLPLPRTKTNNDHHWISVLMPTKIYSLAKTVADCFKYRNKIGLDVAVEALRESWRAHKCTMDELWRYASICRVSNVMRPYLETLK